MSRPTILEVLADPRLAMELTGPSWANWRTVLGAVYGLPLDPAQQAWSCAHTGRTPYEPPAGGWQETAVITGRQSGKTIVASRIVDYEATFPRVRPAVGEYFALLVAQDQRGALRTLLSYARSPFETSPALKLAVVSETADTVTLDTRIKIAAYPCRPAAIRGVLT